MDKQSNQSKPKRKNHKNKTTITITIIIGTSRPRKIQNNVNNKSKLE